MMPSLELKSMKMLLFKIRLIFMLNEVTLDKTPLGYANLAENLSITLGGE